MHKSLFAHSFGRMLISQATLGDFALVSGERAFDADGVKRIWRWR
jgi:hypothetical protein